MLDLNSVLYTYEGIPYTGADFINICLGDEALGATLLKHCTGENSPETVLEDLIKSDEIVFCTKCGRLCERNEVCACSKI